MTNGIRVGDRVAFLGEPTISTTHDHHFYIDIIKYGEVKEVHATNPRIDIEVMVAGASVIYHILPELIITSDMDAENADKLVAIMAGHYRRAASKAVVDIIYSNFKD